ncbi:LacI family DNA-binding transcriptional regulator [Celeribacter sp.]|uniref:LacI family DNA-binding transcriptional regulator n=1 Tax=Celeribacter sp. TaxID=1890673 RepID=UPI003A8CD93A
MRNASWKGPSVKEVSALSGCGLATVDRVLNNRPGVSDKTRTKVLAAFKKLQYAHGTQTENLRIHLFCESGASFNAAMSEACCEANRRVAGVSISEDYVSTNLLDPHAFACDIEERGLECDGVIVVAREHPAINRAIRRLEVEGVPVVCLTTDLPSSRRSAYVGNDQYAAGSTAAFLIGRGLSRQSHKILLVMSEAFRCQQEREMGFRRVLRSDFPHLGIEDRMVSDDRPEHTRDQLTAYFESNGVPAAVYNVAGANRGVAQALEAFGVAVDTVFVGHELTPQSRGLLETGVMDFVLSHDFAAELSAAATFIGNHVRGVRSTPPNTRILIFSRFNI